MVKGILPTQEKDEAEGFECLGYSNWTICSLLSHFCPDEFPTFSLLYWGAHSLLPPEGQYWEKRILTPPKKDETEGFGYLGHTYKLDHLHTFILKILQLFHCHKSYWKREFSQLRISVRYDSSVQLNFKKDRPPRP